MLDVLKRLWKASEGAVAPMVALSMVGLIAAGGIAFDYARLVAMDTELQQAADQAALAAATQLDRSDAAQTNAAAAIQGTAANRLARNFTGFSNGEANASVEIASITFCSSFDDDLADINAACDETNDPEESRVVIVTTALRTADYAFTPIVGAISGTSRATAVAGVESSICNVAPLFVCTGDHDFPSNDDIGRGLRLKTGSQNSWAPGNYGLLDFGPGNPGVIAALLGHGLNGCLPTTETNTQPGNKNVTDAINTRLDVYAGTPATNNPDTVCNTATGAGCPAPSSRKDMVVKVTATENNVTSSTPSIAAPACPADPKAAGSVLELPAAPVVGLGRDTCHYADNCAEGNFGNGVWDFAAYMAANHPGVATSSVPHAGQTPTRYEVYKWELADSATRMGLKAFSTTTSTLRSNGRYDHTITTQCTYTTPKWGSTAYPAQKDRRLLPVIAADCEGLNGVGNADEDFYLIRVFDVFITEPSWTRTTPGIGTDDKEIYAEVVGPAQVFNGGSGLQYYTRNRPYLIR